MQEYENYVYKKEVDWSLLHEGLTLPVDIQVIFTRMMGRFLLRGEVKDITLCLEGKTYRAKITNVNYSSKFKRKNDVIQIRYGSNSDISKALQMYFYKSYQYLKVQRELRPQGDRSMLRLPEDCKEYLAIYTTEYDDSYILEPIFSDDIYKMKKSVVVSLGIVIENATADIKINQNITGISISFQLYA